MQDGNNNDKTSRLIPFVILVVLLGVVGTVFFFMQSASRSVQNRKDTALSRHVILDAKLAAENAAKITALEQKLSNLDKSRIEITAQYVKARKAQQRATTRADLQKELDDAQRAMNDAIDNHPAIVAINQEMARLVKDNNEKGVQMAKLLTAFHAVEKNRIQTLQTNLVVIWKQALQERKEALGDRKKWTDLTPEENEKFMAIQDKYVKLTHAVTAEYAGRKGLDPDEQKAVDEYKELGKVQEANNDKYAKIWWSISQERQRVSQEDPQIAALCQAVVEKNARLMASVDAAPELTEYKTKLKDIHQQMLETSRLLGELKNQGIGTSAAGTFQSQPGKNG
jgi:hypothetical protein